MPFRRLPASDLSRTQALQGALKKSTSTTGAAQLLSAATTTALAALQPKCGKEIAERADASGQQSASTLALTAAADKLRMIVSHFIQVYQLAIARGTSPPQAAPCMNSASMRRPCRTWMPRPRCCCGRTAS